MLVHKHIKASTDTHARLGRGWAVTTPLNWKWHPNQRHGLAVGRALIDTSLQNIDMYETIRCSWATENYWEPLQIKKTKGEDEEEEEEEEEWRGIEHAGNPLRQDTDQMSIQTHWPVWNCQMQLGNKELSPGAITNMKNKGRRRRRTRHRMCQESTTTGHQPDEHTNTLTCMKQLDATEQQGTIIGSCYRYEKQRKKKKKNGEASNV